MCLSYCTTVTRLVLNSGCWLSADQSGRCAMFIAMRLVPTLASRGVFWIHSTDSAPPGFLSFSFLLVRLPWALSRLLSCSGFLCWPLCIFYLGPDIFPRDFQLLAMFCGTGQLPISGRENGFRSEMAIWEVSTRELQIDTLDLHFLQRWSQEECPAKLPS